MNPHLSAKKRVSTLNTLANEHFDILIIGGGINGAGAAREAAMRGLKVALVEMQDFAEGTSSRSSKLIHGGIRYLENMEFKLVFEALSERRNLFTMAPHLVHPLRFVIPVYKHSRVSRWKMAIGMILYDALALFESPEGHESISSEESRMRYPQMDSEELSGSFAYSDAWTDDDRLTLETLRSSVRHGAYVANYIKAKKTEFIDKNHIRTTCEDRLTGEEFTLSSKHIISCVGPWTDSLGETFFENQWHQTLRPSKGIHIVFPHNILPIKEAIVMALQEEKRIVFAIPKAETLIVGTTDTDYCGDPKNVCVEEGDIEYLLKILRHTFPHTEWCRKQIIATYAGVRPLVRDNSRDESATSREHKIWSLPDGVTFVAGGKYTTYRRMAFEVIEEVLKFFSFEKKMSLIDAATKEPLNPLCSVELYQKAQNLVTQIASQIDCDETAVKNILVRHGYEGVRIINQALHQCEINSPYFIWEAEALHAINQTACLSLKDFIIRRTPLFYSQYDHGLKIAESILPLFAKELQWDERTSQSQWQDYLNAINDQESWRNERVGP